MVVPGSTLATLSIILVTGDACPLWLSECANILHQDRGACPRGVSCWWFLCFCFRFLFFSSAYVGDWHWIQSWGDVVCALWWWEEKMYQFLLKFIQSTYEPPPCKILGMEQIVRQEQQKRDPEAVLGAWAGPKNGGTGLCTHFTISAFILMCCSRDTSCPRSSPSDHPKTRHQSTSSLIPTSEQIASGSPVAHIQSNRGV